jgi:hypothetical protein
MEVPMSRDLRVVLVATALLTLGMFAVAGASKLHAAPAAQHARTAR